MGNWGVEVEMERTNEIIWFHKDKYNNLFLAVVILTNFLRKCHLKFTYEVIGD
jgi:hypothetical protein